ncbi:hypothetical protein K440DRAFT_120456 [Wilcoxina mikolae CBS 423.85]|nr:hypothetical protein K440DRAFT_120456 [Wilcoxina mikolae CBS 423.85]
MAINTTPDSPPPFTSLRVVTDDVLTPAAIEALYQDYAKDLTHFNFIPFDVKPTHRYQWLFEHMVNRIQRLYAQREAALASTAAGALLNLEALIQERKRLEAGYEAEVKAKDEMVQGLIKQLQGALAERFKKGDVIGLAVKSAEVTVGSKDADAVATQSNDGMVGFADIDAVAIDGASNSVPVGGEESCRDPRGVSTGKFGNSEGQTRLGYGTVGSANTDSMAMNGTLNSKAAGGEDSRRYPYGNSEGQTRRGNRSGGSRRANITRRGNRTGGSRRANILPFDVLLSAMPAPGREYFTDYDI